MPRSKDERVFPSISFYQTDAGRPVAELHEVRAVLQAHGAPKDFSWHAFRHTLATWLENAGHDHFDRALCLNHTIPGVTSGYSHGFAMDRKRAVLEKWAKHCEGLL